MNHIFQKGDLIQFAYRKGRYTQGIVLDVDCPEIRGDHPELIRVLFYNSESKEKHSTYINRYAIELVQRYRSKH